MATPYLQYGKDGLSGFDSNGVRRIWLDPLNLLFSFFDAAGVPRCEMGNLPTRGVSKSGWGFRVNDAAGLPLYDSTGVLSSAIITQAQLGSITIGFTTTSTTPVVIGTMSFTLSRPATVQTVINVYGGISGGNSASQGSVLSQMDSTTTSFAGGFWQFGDSRSNATLVDIWPNLSVGTHVFNILGYVTLTTPTATTLTVTAVPQVSVLGG